MWAQDVNKNALANCLTDSSQAFRTLSPNQMPLLKT